MSYQVLARKWRPKSFEELVGQKQTAKALINALESQRLHHAYLFTGTRGVGKTTIARILSKSLNCEKGITSKPCGECSSCIEIDQGNFVDLMEIDAASKTKVEDTRELLDNVQYRPTRGRYKVYLIDEVHMLSGHSFNALLKTLEEPPPHVIFLLATTDPQKLPVTVLSRCLQFHLKRMEQPQIVEHLAMILTAELIKFAPEALVPIAKGADGSMRDALSLLDQAIAYSGENLELVSVLEMLGSIDQSYCIQLLSAVHQNDAVDLMDIIQQMSQYSPDYFEVMSDWLSLLHTIAVAQATNSSQDQQINQLAKTISPADLQLYYQLSLQAKKDLPYAPHPRQGFEMALLRVLAFRPGNPQQAKKKLTNNAGEVAQEIRSQVKPETKASTSELLSTEASQNIDTPVDSTLRLVANNVDNPTKQAMVSTNQQPDQVTSPVALKGNIETAEPIVAYTSEVPSFKTANNLNERDSVSVVKKFEVKKTEVTKPDGKKVIQGQPIDQSQAHSTVDKRLYPEAERIALTKVNFENWHFAIDQMSIGGNGLQVLLNSLAKFQGNILTVNYLSKVSHFLTENLRDSLLKQIDDHFKGDSASKLKIEFLSVESLDETPKQKQIIRHQQAIDHAYQILVDEPCVVQLQRELGASLDKQSIRLS